ncbi:uncharacterized protein [Amphiura filiformis]|uniref:uncharacterized protein isoform X2 n=1 Tax=Amphiura filiformis TaxID=82378 RepID=UPI003B218024
MEKLAVIRALVVMCYIFMVHIPIQSIQSSESYLDKQAKCQKIKSRLTESLCQNRLERCCDTGSFDVTEPLCATTTNGFGMIFNNTCTLHYMRCMYSEVCFLKRAPDHPHCRNVYPQLNPLVPPCASMRASLQSESPTENTTNTEYNTGLPLLGEEVHIGNP